MVYQKNFRPKDDGEEISKPPDNENISGT